MKHLLYGFKTSHIAVDIKDFTGETTVCGTQDKTFSNLLEMLNLHTV